MVLLMTTGQTNFLIYFCNFLPPEVLPGVNSNNDDDNNNNNKTCRTHAAVTRSPSRYSVAVVLITENMNVLRYRLKTSREEIGLHVVTNLRDIWGGNSNYNSITITALNPIHPKP